MKKPKLNDAKRLRGICVLLQNACFTRPRAVANLEKTARMHIVRLTNNLVTCPKRMMTKVQ